MIKFLANTIGRWILKRGVEKDKRTPIALNLLEMKTAILVYDILGLKEWDQILSFKKVLLSEGFEKVALIGFSMEKEIPSFVDSQMTQVLGRKEIRFWGTPVDAFNQKFFNQKFDLMVDCTGQSVLPTDYLMALVHAKTKVGASNPENEYIFDLLIDSDKKEDFIQYVKNVIHFLKMINRK